MSSLFTVQQFGADVLAVQFKSEIRAFQAEQRIQMAKAVLLVRRDVIARVRMTFPASRAHKGRGSKMLGPLARRIAGRVYRSKTDVIGVVYPAATAFYGRFQETGLNVNRRTGKTGKTFSSISHRFILPAKPFLAPVATSDTKAVIDIIGNSYGVFYRGVA